MRHMNTTKPNVFERSEYTINGTRTVVLSAGHGSDLVFLHGTGTFPGFDIIWNWTKNHRVIIPFHPNFGESDDNQTIAVMDDYVAHYVQLFDQLRLEKFNLLGFSLGGWIAAEYAIRHPERVRKLILAAPAGLIVDEAPAPDLFKVPPQEVPSYLTHDPRVATGFFPNIPDPAFDAALGREMTALAHVLAQYPKGNPRLAQNAKYLTMPTLVIWGAEDRLMPVAQAKHWGAILPDVQVEYIEGAGHLLFEEKPASGNIVTAFLTNKKST